MGLGDGFLGKYNLQTGGPLDLGLDASKGTPLSPGRTFFGTDTKVLYYDDGFQWWELAKDFNTSGQLLGGNGTAAAPTYSFTNSPNTGIFSSALNTIDFATNGSDRWQITPTGQFIGQNNPAILDALPQNQLVIGGASPTSDIAPGVDLLTGSDAWAQAAVNTSGAKQIIAGGLGQRFYTIITFANLQTNSNTFTITVNGTAVVLTASVDFQAVISNNQTAINLALAINNNGTLGPLVIATAVGAVVYLQPNATCYQESVLTNAAGGDATATGNFSNIDGTVSLASQLTFVNGMTANTPIGAPVNLVQISGPIDNTFRVWANTGATGVGRAVELAGGPALSGSGLAGGVVQIRGGASDGATAGSQALLLGGAGGATGSGGTVTITGGPGGSTSGTAGLIAIGGGAPIDGNGGNVTITATNAQTNTSSNRTGGSLTLTSGGSQGTSTGGTITITAGKGDQAAAGSLNATGGAINITAGQGAGSSTGGAFTWTTGAGGPGAATGASGAITFKTGAGGATSGASGGITIQTGLPVDGSGGNIGITGGAGATTSAASRNGGSVTLTGGASGTSGGNAGTVVCTTGNAGVGSGGAGAAFTVHCGTGDGAGTGGGVSINQSASDSQGGATGNGGAVLINSGKGGATSGASGAITITAGSVTDGAGGLFQLLGTNAATTTAANRAGTPITITAGGSTGTTAGGAITLTAGKGDQPAAGSLNAAGGAITLTAGQGAGSSAGGNIGVNAGAGGPSAATGVGGNANLTAGQGGATSGGGGSCNITGGAAIAGGSNGGASNINGGAGNGAGTGGGLVFTSGAGGATGASGGVTVRSGAGGATSGAAGNVTLNSGTPIDGNGGVITLTGGLAATTTAANRSGGGILITAGGSTGTSQGGSITLTCGVGDAPAAGTNAQGGGFLLHAGAGAGSSSGGGFNVNQTAGDGDGGATGAGGGVLLTAGRGGVTSGNGGVITLKGGAGQGSTSGAGGLASLVGGAGSAGSNNNNAGGVAINTGLPTGTGTSETRFQSGYTLASGSTVQTAYDRLLITSKTVTCSNTTNTATFVLDLNLATTNSGGGCTVFYCFEVADASNHAASVIGEFHVAASNSNGTVIATIDTLGTGTQATSDTTTFTALVMAVPAPTISTTHAQINVKPTWTGGTVTSAKFTYTAIANGRVTLTPQ